MSNAGQSPGHRTGPRSGPRIVLRTVLRAVARLAAAAGLAVDAAVHARLAGQYDAVSATVGQGDLFRVEAALACLAAVFVLVWRRPPGDAFAWLVAAGGIAAIVVYRYVNVGAFWPVPNMYEPVWTPDKRTALAAQAVTVAATTILLLTHHRRRRTPRVV